MLCSPRGRGIGLLVGTRRLSFHEFYNFLLLKFKYIFGKLFFLPTTFTHTHDPHPHPHPRPTTHTHDPRPMTFSYTPLSLPLPFSLTRFYFYVYKYLVNESFAFSLGRSLAFYLTKATTRFVGSVLELDLSTLSHYFQFYYKISELE